MEKHRSNERLTVTKHNLPPQPTPFVGRAQELAEIAALLAAPACRLLTLVGPGGVGKTRLALQVAEAQLDAYRDGVYFVALQPLESPDLIITALAEAARIRLSESGDPKQQVLNHLSGKNMLLVMDNFEHLLDGANLVSDILAAAPGVRVIATSREALNLQEEWLWHVTGMHYPQPEQARYDRTLRVEDYSAVQLFVQHARRMRADFSLDQERDGVVQTVALVDGIPLGIELAAVWVRLLPTSDIAREIARSLDFLETRARNVPPRHRSMRAVLDQSWQRLDGEEQEALKRLSVFRSCFTREAAQAVAGASLQTLSALVDKSLLRTDGAGRYNLHELVRHYAEEQLSASAAGRREAHDRHCRYYASFMREQWGHLRGSRVKEALQAIEDEIDNVRSAWRWAFEHEMEDEIEQAANSLWFFYDTRGRYWEGAWLFAGASAVLGAGVPDSEKSLALGKVVAREGVLRNSLSQFREATELLEEGLAIARRHHALDEIAFCLLRLGEVRSFAGQTLEAAPLFEESLRAAREAGDQWGAAFALHWLAIVELVREQYATAKELAQQALDIYRALDNRWGMAISRLALSWALWSQGDHDAALQLTQEALSLSREVGIRWTEAYMLAQLGQLSLGMGAYQEALPYLAQSIRIALEINLVRYVILDLLDLYRALAGAGERDRAIQALALAIAYTTGSEVESYLESEKASVPAHDFAAALERSRSVEADKALRALLADLEAPEAEAAPRPVLAAIKSLTDPLTAREVEILRLVAAGKSNREIASELVFALGTVKWYLHQVYSKLQVTSRTQAVARARELNLIS